MDTGNDAGYYLVEAGDLGKGAIWWYCALRKTSVSYS